MDCDTLATGAAGLLGAASAALLAWPAWRDLGRRRRADLTGALAKRLDDPQAQERMAAVAAEAARRTAIYHEGDLTLLRWGFALLLLAFLAPLAGKLLCA